MQKTKIHFSFQVIEFHEIFFSNWFLICQNGHRDGKKVPVEGSQMLIQNSCKAHVLLKFCFILRCRSVQHTFILIIPCSLPQCHSFLTIRSNQQSIRLIALKMMRQIVRSQISGVQFSLYTDEEKKNGLSVCQVVSNAILDENNQPVRG